MTSETAGIPFSKQLRQASWARHESLDPTEDGDDSQGILAALLDEKLHLDDYAALTAQQYFVYEVLDEASLVMRDDPIAGAFVFDELSRQQAFDEDLSLLIGPRWRESIAPLESTKRYVQRLREVCFDWPAGFIAHHYTRFLGDLSGGQAFRHAASAAFGFGDGPGVRFYIFDDIGDLSAFKDQYRARLDAAGWDAAEKERVIAEVLLAYDFNEALLYELGSSMRRSV